MSKTLGSVLIIAAAVALNTIPGLGQLATIGLASVVGKAAALTITSALVSSITIAGLASAASLLGLGPGGIKPDTTEAPIKTSRPPRASAYGVSRLYGAYILYETASNGTAVDVFAVHDGLINDVVTWYLGDQSVTLTGNTVNQGADGRYKGGAVSIYWTDGSNPGAGLPAITALVPEWEGRGDGVVLMALTAKSVKLKNFQETYPSGQIPALSLVAQWQLCPDPSAADPTIEAAWTWTENPVRHLLHYMLVREGVDYATKIAPTIDYWIDAAADCDSAMALKAGGTEPRYRSCVAHKHTDQHKDIKGALTATFDGWLAPRADGAFVVYSGRYYEPTVSIGPDEIVSYSWDGVGIDDDQAVNEIIVSYVSAEHDYNTVEGDAWRDEADITARGQILSQPLDVQVPSFPQARRLAKRKMSRIMAPARGTITTNVAGRAVRGERYIHLLIEEAGAVFYDGPAEILGLVRNIASGGVTFEWVAADPDLDDWNAAVEEGEPATKGERVTPAVLDPPEITSATLDAETLSLNVNGPVRDDLTWYVQMREQGATAWGPAMEWPDIDAGSPITLEANIGTQNAILEVEVAYQIGDGRTSDWSAAETVDATQTDLFLVAKSADMAIAGRSAIKAGGSNAWAPGVRSATPIAGSSRVRFRPTFATKDVMFALNVAAPTDMAYTSLDYAINADGAGILNVFESGAGSLGLGSFVAGEELWIEYDSAAGTVKYFSDAGATLLKTTSGVASGLAFYLDSVFYDIGSRADELHFEPL